MEIELNCMTDSKMHSSMTLNVLLLAAGMGTRLRPLTNSMPKCMVPIMGRPLMDYWIELLFSKEIEAPVGPIGTVFINTHYLPESVDQYVKTSAHSDKLSTIHEEALLGTAGTFVKLISRLKGHDLLLAHADNLTLFDVNAFVHKHHNRPTGCIASMMTFKTDDPRSCGIVELDAQDVAVAFHEKLENPPGNLANAAVFLFSPEAIETIELMSKNKNLFDVSLDIVPSLLGKMATFQNKIYHRDIGNAHSLAQAEKEFPSVYQAFKQQTQLLH
jgi:mannose-1-phosphate guanylyltransferase